MIVRTMLFAAVVLPFVLSAQAPLALTGGSEGAGADDTRRVTLARLGLPDGLPLEGATAAGTLNFPLPVSVRVLGATLTLSIDVTRHVLSGSNIQVFVNGTRRRVIPRADIDTVPISLSLPLLPSDLLKPAVVAEVRSYLSMGRDRCLDERLGSAYVTVLPESHLDFMFDPLSVRSPEARWSLLPDTVRIALPASALSREAFMLGYNLALELRADGHVERFVKGGDVSLSLDSADVIRSLISWRKFAVHRARPLPANPTFSQMGIGDISRSYGSRGTWRIPIDLRTLPTDRVPNGLEINVASASASPERGVQYFISLNGTLLRTFIGSDDGSAQTLGVQLPQYLLNTYNELRVDVQRVRDASNLCQESEALYPAQILGSSVLFTTGASNAPKLFTGTAIRLADHFPLYVPRAGLAAAGDYISAAVSLARGTWGYRSPRIELFDRLENVKPKEGFAMVAPPGAPFTGGAAKVANGQIALSGPAIGEVDLVLPDSDATVIEVVHVEGQSGIVATLPRVATELPDGPESYGNADVLVVRRNGALIRTNSLNLSSDELYGNFGWLGRWAWTPQLMIGSAAVVLLVLGLLVLAWRGLGGGGRKPAAKRVTK